MPANNLVYARILEDDRGALWLSTKPGPVAVRSAAGGFRNYDERRAEQRVQRRRLLPHRRRRDASAHDGFAVFHPGAVRDNLFDAACRGNHRLPASSTSSWPRTWRPRARRSSRRTATTSSPSSSPRWTSTAPTRTATLQTGRLRPGVGPLRRPPLRQLHEPARRRLRFGARLQQRRRLERAGRRRGCASSRRCGSGGGSRRCSGRSSSCCRWSSTAWAGSW